MLSRIHKEIIGGFFFVMVILLAFFLLRSSDVSTVPSDKIANIPQSDKEEQMKEEKSEPLETKTNRLIVGENKEEQNFSLDDQEKYMTARKEISEKKCDGIEALDLKNRCYDEVLWTESVKKNDETICTKIANEEKQTACLDEIRLKKAIQEKNFSICPSLKIERFIEICNEESERNAILVAKNLQDCEKISSSSLKNQCQRQFLTEEQFHFSPEKCWSIGDENDRYFCEDMVLSYYLDEKSSFECGIFSPEFERKCDDMKTKEKERDLFARAVEDKDVRFCNELSSQDMRQNCIDTVAPFFAFQQKDRLYCNVISDLKKRDKCLKEQGEKIDRYFFETAKLSKDKTSCEKILDDGKKEKCLQNFD